MGCAWLKACASCVFWPPTLPCGRPRSERRAPGFLPPAPAPSTPRAHRDAVLRRPLARGFKHPLHVLLAVGVKLLALALLRPQNEVRVLDAVRRAPVGVDVKGGVGGSGRCGGAACAPSAQRSGLAGIGAACQPRARAWASLRACTAGTWPAAGRATACTRSTASPPGGSPCGGRRVRGFVRVCGRGGVELGVRAQAPADRARRGLRGARRVASQGAPRARGECSMHVQKIKGACTPCVPLEALCAAVDHRLERGQVGGAVLLKLWRGWRVGIELCVRKLACICHLSPASTWEAPRAWRPARRRPSLARPLPAPGAPPHPAGCRPSSSSTAAPRGCPGPG